MNKKLSYIIFGALFASLCLVAIPWAYTFHSAPLSTSPEDWGVFGDYFGGVLSTLVSIFGFIAVIFTIKKQSDSIQAQLASIELDKETRDDEVYYRQALQCLEEALTALTDPTDGKVRRDRVTWLQSARLTLTAEELSSKITSSSMRSAYAASKKLVRARFQSRLDPASNPETMQSDFFSGPDWDSYYKNRVSQKLEKHSVYVIYRFTSWQDDEIDLIDNVIDKININEISKTYLGATLFLNSKSRK